MHLRFSSLCFALVSLCATASHAANAAIEALPAQRFRPAIGDGILDAYTGDVPEHFVLRAGLWSNYAYRPMVIAGGGGALVRNRLDIDAVVAVTPLPRVMFGLGLRVTPWQDRDPGLIATYGGLSGGLGDLRFMGKVGLVQGAFAGRFDLALLGTLSVAATSQGDMLTDAGFTASPELAASTQALPVTLALNLGMQFRPALRTGNYMVEHAIVYRLGARLVGAKVRIPVDIDAVLSGNAALRRPFGNRADSPLEVGAAVRLPLRRDTLAITLAGFAGLIGGYNEPAVRIVAGLSFTHDFGAASPSSRPGEVPATQPAAPCLEAASLPASVPVDASNDGASSAPAAAKKPPRPKPVKPAASPTDPTADSDGDGIVNSRDGAPYIPEDLDGYQDDDGIPELGPQ